MNDMIGKKVKCVFNGYFASEYLTEGGIYTVTAQHHQYDEYQLDGVECFWRAERFVPVEEDVSAATQEMLDTIFGKEEPKEAPARNKYSREISKGVFVDVYDVLRAFNVTDPCLQHLIKKALAVGQRGHKDAATDYKDILASAERALEMHNVWNN